MTSETSVGCVCQTGELLLRPGGGAGPVSVVASGVVGMRRLDALHEGGVRYWRRVGGTPRRWGFRAVRTAPGQWIPTLVEQAASSRLGAGPESNHDHRDPARELARTRQGEARPAPG